MSLTTTHHARRTWTQVDEAAIEQNTRRMRGLVGSSCRVLAVVKANGYGHGATSTARAALRGGAAGLAAATIGEALQLRAAQIEAPILVLGPASENEIGAALAADLALTVCDPNTLQALVACAEATGQTPRAHLKIDTGMCRLGLLPHEAVPLLRSEPGARLIRWEGLFTHFACADEPERCETNQQLACFEDVRAALGGAGFSFPLIHAANSAGAIAFPHARYDAVRTGIALYGLAPSSDLPLPHGFRPALSFCTNIVRLADAPRETPVSYSGVYRTQKPRRIATIAAGYADGVRRAPAWREALVGGAYVPIVGRVCMDYAMLDVSDTEAAVGDEVVLLGSQGDATISAAEVASWLGTSVYEVITSIGK